MVESGKDFQQMDRAIFGLFRVGGAGTDHLAVSHAAAGEETHRHARPVIATGTGIDPRSAAEFAPHHHGDVLFHPAIMQVLEQSAQAAIQIRQLAAEVVEVVAVRVPATPVESDGANAGFHEATGGEEHATFVLAITFANFGIFLFQIDGVGDFATGHHADRPLREAIQGLHLAGAVHVAADFVDGGKQVGAAAKAVFRHAADEFQIAPLRTIGFVGGAEESFVPFVVGNIRGSAFSRRTLQLGHDGADAWPPTDVPQFVAAPAGLRVEVAVVVVHADQRANDGVLVGHLGEQRKMLADFNAAHVRFDRIEFSAKFARSIRLEIEHVLVGRTATQMNIDDRLLRRAGAGKGFRPQQASQTQAADSRPDLQKAPPGNPIAIPLLRAAGDVEHERGSLSEINGEGVSGDCIGGPTTARALTTYDASANVRYAG